MISSASDSIAASSFKPARTADRSGSRSDDSGFSALVDSNVAADETPAARAEANASRQKQRQEQASDTRDRAETRSGRQNRRTSDADTPAKSTDTLANSSADARTLDDVRGATDSKFGAEPIADASSNTKADAETVAPTPEPGDLPDGNATEADGGDAHAATTDQTIALNASVSAAVTPPAPDDTASALDDGGEIVAGSADARAGASQMQRKPDGADAQKGETLQQGGMAKTSGDAPSQAQSAAQNPDVGATTLAATDDANATPSDTGRLAAVKTARAASQAQAQATADAGGTDAAASAVKDEPDDAAVASAAHLDLKQRAVRASAQDGNGASNADTGASADSQMRATARAATPGTEDSSAHDATPPEANNTDAAKSDPVAGRTERQAASVHTSGSDARALGQGDLATGLRIAVNDNGAAQTATMPTQAIQHMQGQPVQQSMQPQAASVASVPAVPLNGLAVEIAARSRDGSNRFEIRLDPKELGRIDVRLDVDRHGNVTSRLFVERAETLDLLRRDAPNLERALQDAGLKTSDNGLQFSLRDQSQNQRDDSQTARARILVADEDIAAADVAGRSYGRTLGGAGGLDIRV